MNNEQEKALVELITSQGKVMDSAIKTIDMVVDICAGLQKQVARLNVLVGEAEADAKTALYKLKKMEGK